jgi:CheY-like chemotaxis protein
MSPDSFNASFARAVQRALVNLYEPGKLRASPLVGLLCLQHDQNPAAALQRVLLAAIEALKPAADVPPEARAWRSYRVLFHRFTEQCTQVEVARTLGFSERQLRREEQQAVRVLAEYLWRRYGVEFRALEADATSGLETSSREQELAWLGKSLPPGTAVLSDVIAAVLRLVSALAEDLGVRLEATLPTQLLPAAMEPAALRQALLNALTPAIRAASHGTVRISAQGDGCEITILVRVQRHPAHGTALSQDDVECLEMARDLLTLGGGALVVSLERAFTVTITLPAAGQATVLVIDDNVDTLQLFQRYLSGTPYHFYGARDPEKAISLAADVHPRIIVLDLMLPGLDGWEVLGRLRVRPETRDIPIVVCSILPQEQLALALGAAAFIRKPVSRATLLAILDRLAGSAAAR